MTSDTIATLEGLRDWLRKRAGKCTEYASQCNDAGSIELWSNMAKTYRARADAFSTALSILAEREWRPTHHHIKSGGLYQVIARGIDATNAQLAEDREVVIYRNEHGQWFCRIVREFDDGRFVAAAPQPPQPPKGEGDE